MDLDLISVHEACHAFCMWLVRHPFDRIELMLTGDEVTNAQTKSEIPPHSDTVEIRRCLLILVAGKEATQARWPGSEHDFGDCLQGSFAMTRNLRRSVAWVSDGTYFNDHEAREMWRTAKDACQALLGIGVVRNAIDELGQLVATTKPNEENKIIFDAGSIANHFDQLLGQSYCLTNPLSPWLNGTK